MAAPRAPFVCYDEYILVNENGVREMFVDMVTPLDQYPVKLVEDYSGATHGMTELPGEQAHTIVYRQLTDSGRRISRSLFKAVHVMEEQGAYLSDFTVANVMVTQTEKAMFRGIRIFRNQPADIVEAGIMRNLAAVAVIIRTTICKNNPPVEINLLLEMVAKNENRSIYHVHASLVPLPLYHAAFKEFYDVIRFTLDPIQFTSFLDKLPHMQDWRTAIHGNDLLLACFGFNPKAYTKVSTSTTQGQLTKSQSKALGTAPGGQQSNLTQDQVNWIEALHQIEFQRNRPAHRMEHLVKWMVDQRALQLTPKCNAQSSELVARVRFPETLHYMQLFLLSINMLFDLPLDTYF